MGWPEWIVVAAMVLSTLFYLVKVVRDRSMSSERATIQVFTYAVSQVLYALLLHAGGFW